MDINQHIYLWLYIAAPLCLLIITIIWLVVKAHKNNIVKQVRAHISTLKKIRANMNYALEHDIDDPAHDAGEIFVSVLHTIEDLIHLIEKPVGKKKKKSVKKSVKK